jgi:hypothetical protein
MKKLVELLLCFLHPLAVILMWINLASRTDLTPLNKVACLPPALGSPTSRILPSGSSRR